MYLLSTDFIILYRFLELWNEMERDWQIARLI